MKKILGMFLTIVLLLGLLNVGASAEEAKYQSVTFANSYATLTIDKARVSYSGKEGEYTIYGVPDGAEMTVTITGAQTGFNLYIGASFTRLSNNGDANTGGTLERTAEYVLTADSVLQMVNLADENGNALYEDNNWDGSADVIRQNGTYHFTLSAPGCVGWNMTPLCGTKITGGAMPTFSDSYRFHGFLNGNFYGKDGALVSFTVDKAEGSMQTFTFADVAADSFCYDAAQWAVQKNITTGKTTTTFVPGETCTNGQILTFLWRASGSPEPTVANPFTDVNKSDYYYKSALWACGQGLVTGDTFGASVSCTRAMAVTYLWTLAGKPFSEGTAAFTDVAADAPYAQAVTWAVAKGISLGQAGTTFAPDASCTRGQIVTFLYRDLAW